MGNVRVSFTREGAQAAIVEKNDYYAFGLKHGTASDTSGVNYNYEYSGKEFQQEIGMNDYGARFYMPDIGRRGVVDPLAEVYRRHSPYNYAVNNPMRFIDPDGMAARNTFDAGVEYTGQEAIDLFNAIKNLYGYNDSSNGDIPAPKVNSFNFLGGASGGGVIIGSILSPWMQANIESFNVSQFDFNDGDDNQKKALEYKKQYEFNKDVQMAETIFSEALMETTQDGKILRYGQALKYSRNQLVKVYGSDDIKTINRIYGIIIDKLNFYRKGLSSADGIAYSTVISGIVVSLGANTVRLELKNEYLLYKIKKLDINVYQMIKTDS